MYSQKESTKTNLLNLNLYCPQNCKNLGLLTFIGDKNFDKANKNVLVDSFVYHNTQRMVSVLTKDQLTRSQKTRIGYFEIYNNSLISINLAYLRKI